MVKNTGRRDGLCLVLLTSHTPFSAPKDMRKECDGFLVMTVSPQEWDKNYLSRRIGKDNVDYLIQEEEHFDPSAPTRAAVLKYRHQQPIRVQIPKVDPKESLLAQAELQPTESTDRRVEHNAMEPRVRRVIYSEPRTSTTKVVKSQKTGGKSLAGKLAIGLFTATTLALAYLWPPTFSNALIVGVGYFWTFLLANKALRGEK